VHTAALHGNVTSSVLARAFVVIELSGQHRSVDTEHTANIEAIRYSPREKPIEHDHMQLYPILRAHHIAADPELFTAPVLVCKNRPRELIIKKRMELFAEQQRRVVIAYYKPKSGPGAAAIDRLPAERLAALYADTPELVGRFCVGCPAMELRNVSVCHGLTNGTIGRMHSLTLDPKEDTEQLNRELAQAVPGSTVMLRYAPVSINCAFPVDTTHWPLDCVLDADDRSHAVIPFKPFQGDKSDSITVDINGVGHTLTVPCDFVSATFALTFHKAQVSY
jgi:hypothetical protein